jgi:hypothetical protein
MSNSKKWISLNWLARKISVHRYTAQYRAKQSQLRTMKFGGVRYIESNDAVCLAKGLASEENLDEILDAIEQHCN